VMPLHRNPLNASSIRNGLTTEDLASAQRTLSLGNTLAGRRIASQARVRAIAARDTHLEAEASLVLGQALVLDSRFGLALGFGTTAHKLFVRESNVNGQTRALAIVSYCASALGSDEEAVRAANEAMSLWHGMAPPFVQALAFNYLGVASFWARDFHTAGDTLEASAWFARRALKDPPASFHPLINFCFSEVLRVVEGELNGQEPGDTSKLEELVAQAWALARRGETGTLNSGASDIGIVLLIFASFFMASWSGGKEKADAYYLACLERTPRLPPNSWLHSLIWWARVEREKASGDLKKSISSARAMGDFARLGEHVQLRGLAHKIQKSLEIQLA
jgi:hypothetical protein